MNCRIVLRLFPNCRFVLRLFQSDRRTQIEILSFSSPDLLNTVGVPKTFLLDVCFTTFIFPGCFFRAASQSSQDLPFGCLLHHFYFSGVFLPSSISIPLQTRDHHGSIFLFLLALFGFGFELLCFFSLANSS